MTPWHATMIELAIPFLDIGFERANNLSLSAAQIQWSSNFQNGSDFIWLNTCLVVVVQLIFINRQRYFPFPCKLFSINRHSLHQRNPTSRSTVTSWIEIWKIEGETAIVFVQGLKPKPGWNPPYLFNQERMLYVEDALPLGHSTTLAWQKLMDLWRERLKSERAADGNDEIMRRPCLIWPSKLRRRHDASSFIFTTNLLLFWCPSLEVASNQSKGFYGKQSCVNYVSIHNQMCSSSLSDSRCWRDRVTLLPACE